MCAKKTKNVKAFERKEIGGKYSRSGKLGKTKISLTMQQKKKNEKAMKKEVVKKKIKMEFFLNLISQKVT